MYRNPWHVPVLPLGPEISRTSVSSLALISWDGSLGWSKSSFQEPLGQPWGHRAALGLGWELGRATAPGRGAEHSASQCPLQGPGQDGAGALRVQLLSSAMWCRLSVQSRL